MEKFTVNDLNPIYATQKSFHQKAKVYTIGSAKILTSYDTVVAIWSPKTSMCVFPWPNHSRCTQRHVKDFWLQFVSNSLPKPFGNFITKNGACLLIGNKVLTTRREELPEELRILIELSNAFKAIERGII